jgi:hypothetical protein
VGCHKLGVEFDRFLVETLGLRAIPSSCAAVGWRVVVVTRQDLVGFGEPWIDADGTLRRLAPLRLSPRFLQFRGSRQNSAPRAHVWRYGVWLGGLRFSEKPSTQTQLAIDG